MKKLAVLPISLFAALALTACGDDSSSGPDNTTPSSGIEQPGSSDGTDPTSSAGPEGTLPGTSSDGIELSSSSTDPVGPTPTSSGSTTPTVEFTTEAVALPDMGCVTEPVTFGSGVKVTCNGEFAGNILDDSDTSPFDPNAAAYTSFVGIQKVFAAIQPTDKAVFILRHAHRTKSEEGGLLTGLGYIQASEVGKKIASTEEIKFWHSEIERTLQTCMAIAQGRGQTTISHTALADLNGGWFEKDAAKIEEYNASVATTYDVVSRWAYNEYTDPTVNYDEGFYDLMERGTQFMNEIIIAQVAPQSRISVVISHDQMLYPLVVYATNRMLEMKHHEDKSWLNFLAGVAVIIHADGSVKYVPVMGLDEGTVQS
ncbi:MAG: phosphoglycerate mutase family protein [Fibrobacter sp.]|uniref:histidine phosphatase family protein n=1 Tax=Fibrobacter sp. TaxID=35828 RepID=UPI0025C0D27F|nr:histidine phosphatase family protein [Fibrobacter sp.]MBQ9224581.1 phosphoglycerate mutase family protein [Fibrobacter sp.]